MLGGLLVYKLCCRLMVSKQYYSRTIFKQIKFYLSPIYLVATICVQISKIAFLHLYNTVCFVNTPAKLISKPLRELKIFL